jgi:hypothetical protein
VIRFGRWNIVVPDTNIRFLVRLGSPFLRPGLIIDKTPRAAAVKDWPQANRAAARTVLDGGEHGGPLKRGGLNQPSAVLASRLSLKEPRPAALSTTSRLAAVKVSLLPVSA